MSLQLTLQSIASGLKNTTWLYPSCSFSSPRLSISFVIKLLFTPLLVNDETYFLSVLTEDLKQWLRTVDQDCFLGFQKVVKKCIKKLLPLPVGRETRLCLVQIEELPPSVSPANECILI